jgi:hypothetical protein
MSASPNATFDRKKRSRTRNEELSFLRFFCKKSKIICAKRCKATRLKQHSAEENMVMMPVLTLFDTLTEGSSPLNHAEKHSHRTSQFGRIFESLYNQYRVKLSNSVVGRLAHHLKTPLHHQTCFWLRYENKHFRLQFDVFNDKALHVTLMQALFSLMNVNSDIITLAMALPIGTANINTPPSKAPWMLS